MKQTTHTSIQTSVDLHTHNESGFTLVELMITVAILGIVLSSAIGLFNLSTQKSYIETCNENMVTITTAINRAAALNGKNLDAITDADVNPYITGGMSSLKCQAQKNPRPSYHVQGGQISPVHNHQ